MLGKEPRWRNVDNPPGLLGNFGVQLKKEPGCEVQSQNTDPGSWVNADRGRAVADTFIGGRVRGYALFAFQLPSCHLLIGPGLQCCLYDLTCLEQVWLMRDKIWACVILSILSILHLHPLYLILSEERSIRSSGAIPKLCSPHPWHSNI